jgi:hypothetical protein
MWPSFRAFKEEMVAIKEAGAFGNVMGRLATEAGTHKAELAGLGMLAAPSIDEAQAHARAAVAGDYGKAGVEKRTLLPHAAKPLTEVAGLGVLAGPSIAHLMKPGPSIAHLMKH